VETVVITGAWTNFSIEHTARHAADAGYRAIVVTDGTSTIDDEWQSAALNYALQNIAERVPAKDVVAALERRSKR
jgi:nicotinamidase-related amidase